MDRIHMLNMPSGPKFLPKKALMVIRKAILAVDMLYFVAIRVFFASSMVYISMLSVKAVRFASIFTSCEHCSVYGFLSMFSDFYVASSLILKFHLKYGVFSALIFISTDFSNLYIGYGFILLLLRFWKKGFSAGRDRRVHTVALSCALL